MPSRAGSKNKKTQAAKANTQAYFSQMLDDAREAELWGRFLASNDEEIALRTFLRAVEYKRGKPIQPIEGEYEPREMDFGALPVPCAQSRTVNKPN